MMAWLATLRVLDAQFQLTYLSGAGIRVLYSEWVNLGSHPVNVCQTIFMIMYNPLRMLCRKLVFPCHKVR